MYARLLQLVNKAVEGYDSRHYQSTPCSGNILCSRQGRRHKDGCIGRTEPFTVYVRGIRSIH